MNERATRSDYQKGLRCLRVEVSTWLLGSLLAQLTLAVSLILLLK
jgi:hypothetical protein